MAAGDTEDFDGQMNIANISPHPQATFTSTRRARPPILDFAGEDAENHIPLKPSKISRRESKGGLRGIFTRTKIDKSAALPVVAEPPATAILESSCDIAEKVLPPSNSSKRVTTVPAPESTLPLTPRATRKASVTNLRLKSLKHRQPTPMLSPKSGAKSSSKPPTRISAVWDPPPLFQAYPQAIKHATLLASTLSADSLLRINNYKITNSLRDEIAQSHSDFYELDQKAASSKVEKVKRKHRKQMSGSTSKGDWIQKIFVLVTSGYLLQYAGEGSFDRLPEKMMQLGKDSVAFASDVIPGKHWVLQISQSMNADGTPSADSRSILSRLAIRGADYRRTATSLLLVLNSAEDMDSWIAVVRREIESLGGKKLVSETGKPKPDDKVMQLEAQPTHRYIIHRDLNRFPDPASPTSPSYTVAEETNAEEPLNKLEDAASILASPVSIIRPSTGHHSIATSVMSQDGRQLENLRDSSNRLSSMSSGQRTLITSQSSSRTTSPTHESYSSSFNEFPPKISVEDVRTRPNAVAINNRRRSMQAMHIPLLDAPLQPKNHRHSTFTMPTLSASSQAQIPNFSTPKRLSRVLVPNAPAIPTTSSMTPTSSIACDDIVNEPRKRPPNALDVVLPLSTVEDSLPPNDQAPSVFPPADSSFKKIQQRKASVVSISPKSTFTSTPISSVSPPRRRSTLRSPGSAEAGQLKIHFPKRVSSMQALRDALSSAPEVPVTSGTLLPAASISPLPVAPYYSKHEKKIVHNQDLEKGTLSPLPILANSKQKLRRPNSMHIRSPTTSLSLSSTRSPKKPFDSSSRRLSTINPSTTLGSHGTTSPASLTVLSPAIHHLKVQNHPKVVGARKSMPNLVEGPPPAPPPNYALPPLPPGGADRRSRM